MGNIEFELKELTEILEYLEKILKVQPDGRLSRFNLNHHEFLDDSSMVECEKLNLIKGIKPDFGFSVTYNYKITKKGFKLIKRFRNLLKTNNINPNEEINEKSLKEFGFIEDYFTFSGNEKATNFLKYNLGNSLSLAFSQDRIYLNSHSAGNFSVNFKEESFNCHVLQHIKTISQLKDLVFLLTGIKK